MIRPLSVDEVRQIAFELAAQTMQWNEPIPPFETRFEGKLGSCLASPFQTFNKRDLYRGLESKAAFLFYLMIKNHPFVNGNKRIAVTTLLCLLDSNGKWLRVSANELYKKAVWVAESDPRDRVEVLALLRKFIERSLIESSANS
jgi:death on curing protein